MTTMRRFGVNLAALMLALWCSANLAMARPENAPGGPEGKGPCVRACTQANKGCVHGAHLLKLSCRARCAQARFDFLDACDPDGDGEFDFDPNEPQEFDPETGAILDPCTLAQMALDACLTPCKRTFKGASTRCVLRLRQCYFSECGIIPPPPDRDNTEGE